MHPALVVHPRPAAPAGRDELQLGNEVREELSVAAEDFLDRGAPAGDLVLRLAQYVADDDLERLCQGGVRNVALVLRR
jgi:hypothetical protein